MQVWITRFCAPAEPTQNTTAQRFRALRWAPPSLAPCNLQLAACTLASGSPPSCPSNLKPCSVAAGLAAWLALLQHRAAACTSARSPAALQPSLQPSLHPCSLRLEPCNIGLQPAPQHAALQPCSHPCSLACTLAACVWRAHFDTRTRQRSHIPMLHPRAQILNTSLHCL